MSETFDSDVRYGESFLSIGNNKKSELGEIMADKITGELYIKRPADGRIVSFKQKSQTTYDTLREFNVQFAYSSVDFLYPDDPGSYLICNRYDVEEFFKNDLKKDLLVDNYSFSSSVNLYDDIRMQVSTKTNGIFVKPITRLGDRNIVGYFTGQFRAHEAGNFLSVIKTFEEWLELSKLYPSVYSYTEWKEFSSWDSCNALVDCTITVIGKNDNNETVTNVKNVTAPLHLNEYSFVKFPSDYNEEITNIYSIQVVINKIYCPKLQYERYLSETSASSSGLVPIVTRLMEPDYKVPLHSIDVFSFIDSVSQLPTNENTIINNCIDVTFMEKAIEEIESSNGTKAIQASIEKPENWPVDGAWAEELRHIEVGEDVEVTENFTENNFSNIERELYHDGIDTLEFTLLSNDKKDIFIREIERSN